MNTPPPLLSIPGTEEPPSGQHGPASGIRTPETATATQEPQGVAEDVGPIDPTAGMGVEPMLELPCAEPDCTATLPVQPRHAENLTGWLCRNHKDTTA